jgi:tRNA A-37 threonylcarbamoyl transferase component Bud32
MQPNPYEYKEPLAPGSGRGVLLDRAAAQRQAVNLLRRGGFLTVSAPPRSGVTTFLLGLRKLLPASVYVDLANLSFTDDPPREAARVLAREVGAQNPKLQLPENPVSVTDVLSTVARSGGAGEGLTVIVDGFDAWSDEPARRLVLAFRAAYTELRTYSPGAQGFSVITGSSADLRDLTASGRTSPLNIAQNIFLQDFTADEVLELMRKGLSPISDENEVVEWSRRTFQWTAGHPAISQMIGHLAFDLRSSGKSSEAAWKEIQPSVVEMATDLIGSSLGVLAGRTDLRRTASQIYSRDDVPFDRIHRPIRELLHLGLIRPDDAGLGKPRSQLYRELLAASLNVPGVSHPSAELWRSPSGDSRPAGTKSAATLQAIPQKENVKAGDNVKAEKVKAGGNGEASQDFSPDPPLPFHQPSTEEVPLEIALTRDLTTPGPSSQSRPPILESNTIIGGCIIVRRIGRGGMGEVYLARHVALDLLVAIKVMRNDSTGDRRLAQRFLREARTAAQLSHENIVQIRNVGREGDYQFIEMEYISGGSLADLIDKGPFTNIPLAVEYLTGACNGLLVAHEKGIIHRDLKPDNLMIAKDGKIKVVDFGLAALGQIDGSRLTTEGTIVGTPHYMAPEQWEARDVDERSDIYSLGATFYHLLSGKPPYEGRTAMELIANFTKSTRVSPLEENNSAVPGGLAEIILKMIEKDPKSRYSGMREILDECEGLRLY